MAPPGNQAANGEDESQPEHREKPAYSTHLYDAAGNVTNEGTHSYQYDAENRLVNVDSGVTAQYWYDHQNRRIVKLIAGSKTDCIWDGSQLVEEHNGNASNPGTTLTRYVYAGSRMLARIAGGVTRYHVSDRLSARLVLDTSGNVVGRQAHLPFGEDFGESGEQEKHHFTSYERDGESGLDYAINRGYSPSVGRFQQADPYKASGYMVDPQSWNRYSYVENDPVNYNDKLGLFRSGWVPPPSPSSTNTFGDPFGDGNHLGGNPFGDGSVQPELPADHPSGGGGVEDWIANLIKQLGQVNDCEAELAKQVLGALGPSLLAVEYIRQLTGAEHTAQRYEKQHGGSQDDNPVNARKHCIWSCELSKRFDEETARQWTDAHECGGTSESSNMDYHNNWIGRLLGKKSAAHEGTCEELCEQTPVQVGGTPKAGSLYAIDP